jgi:DNA-binding beta-propeller fold protein YncE
MVQFLLSGARGNRGIEPTPAKRVLTHHGGDGDGAHLPVGGELGGQIFTRPRMFRLAPAFCLLLVACCLSFPGKAAAGSKTKPPQLATLPELELTGGRRLLYQGSVGSEREVREKHFWGRLADFIAGEPDYHGLVTPYSVVTDSHGRIIVTDPGASGIHIFDYTLHKYKFITRIRDVDGLSSPQCVAVDADDNIYVTDSFEGKIFVFDANGKFQRVVGSIKGEGYFKRATGIAIDSAAQRIYVSDTVRQEVWVLDMQGNVTQKIGMQGTGEGQFNFPTELRLDGQDLLVVDAMNFRVQVLDRTGKFEYAVGQVGDGSGYMFRPKGIGRDSEGHLYVVEGLSGIVQVFDRQGRLLYYFGKKGSGFGDFQLPTGLYIDHNDRVFVVDSFNRRVQVFQYFALGKNDQH